MLWWGMDETVAELFACHLQASNFVGNPLSIFCAKIGGIDYGPDDTPNTIGLYGGRYTVVVNPGECRQDALLYPF